MTINTEILLTTEVLRSPRVQQLEGIFDVPPSSRSEHRQHHRFTLPATWNIGVIVGPSGAGKTALARQLFGPQLIDHWPWPADRSILDAFPVTLGIRDITALLCSVGFSSPPAWVRPFAALSNGEQFRVALARTLAELPDLAVVDEFTSVVDRTAARIGSAAVAKAVRSRNQKFVAITCHYDVLDWLNPDWVYEPHTRKFITNRNPLDSRESLQRPPIDLEIIRVHSSCWPIFCPHHYLSGKLHRSATCFLALARLPKSTPSPCTQGEGWGGGSSARQSIPSLPPKTESMKYDPPIPAAFVAALPFPHPIRPGWREHRCVCLPQFQGVGIGNALSEFVANVFVTLGHPYFSTTSHPAMIRHRLNSPLWKLRRPPSFHGRHRGLDHAWIGAPTRMTAGFEFRGSAKFSGPARGAQPTATDISDLAM